MKLLATLFFLLMIASCSIFHKSINEVKQEGHNNSLSIKDSTGKITVDSSGGSGSIQFGKIIIDSGFDIVTEEVIKEVIDSNVTHRVTIRTIKEKGQKRIEQSTSTIRNDSASKKVSQRSNISQLQAKDSSSAIVATKKNIARTSFLPWWIWLIVVAVSVLGWEQRNPIIEFFKSNR
jgi:hypothetical protein